MNPIELHQNLSLGNCRPVFVCCAEMNAKLPYLPERSGQILVFQSLASWVTPDFQKEMLEIVRKHGITDIFVYGHSGCQMLEEMHNCSAPAHQTALTATAQSKDSSKSQQQEKSESAREHCQRLNKHLAGLVKLAEPQRSINVHTWLLNDQTRGLLVVEDNAVSEYKN